MLTLDAASANELLQWHTVWTLRETIEHTAQWYRRCLEQKNYDILCDWADYTAEAERQEAVWTK